MVKRCAAATFLEGEKNFRRILDHRNLWMLKAQLDERVEVREEVAN